MDRQEIEKRYGVLGNVRMMLRDFMLLDRRNGWILALDVVCRVAVPFLLVLVPGLIVEWLGAGLALEALMARIALLMLVVMIMGSIFIARDKKRAAAMAAAASANPAPAPVEAAKPVAPGSAGELKLHDVEPKTAAMIMAIVADKMGKPLNELRFISIKEVK